MEIFPSRNVSVFSLQDNNNIRFATTYPIRCVFSSSLKNQFILLFNLFLLLFMGLTVLFDTIHESPCTILVHFYLYL